MSAPLDPAGSAPKRRWLILGGLAAAILLAALGVAAWVDREPSPTVPTARVERTDFIHRVTAEGQLQAAESTRLTVPPNVRQNARIAWIAPEGARVEAGEIVVRFDPVAMTRQLEDGDRELRRADLGAERTREQSTASLADLQAAYENATRELEHAQRFQLDDTEIYSRLDILEAAIDEELAIARREHADGAIGSRRSRDQADLALLEIDRREASATIDEARTGLAGLELRAPHPGVLVRGRNWRGEPRDVGTEVWRGELVAEIPDLETIEAEIYVLEADAGGVEAGLRADVRVEARPNESYRATVKKVDAQSKTRSRGSPVQFFGAVLAFDDPTEGLKPGQRVRATVTLAERADALVVPRQAVERDNGSASVVVLGTDGAFARRAVKLGPSSPALAVIEDGLAEGDVVALAVPEGLAPLPSATGGGVRASGAAPNQARGGRGGGPGRGGAGRGGAARRGGGGS